MEVRLRLLQAIQASRRSTIGLDQLEREFNGQPIDYEVFAEALLQLENEGMLELVQAHGRNGKTPALGYQYRIRRQHVQEAHVKRLHRHSRELHPLLQLDRYYSLTEAQWLQDWPYIERLHRYLEQHALPDEEAPAPERSFELVGDEKWITEKGGQVLLERLGLYNWLRIMPVSDPLMLALNPVHLANPARLDLHRHFIVENKTTFQGLLGAISGSPFATLIYGCGRKIVGNLEMLRFQYPISKGEHRFYYFGDIDPEGIRIWHDLRQRQPVQLAVSFYTACLDKPPASGKENQRRHDPALTAFHESLPEAYRARTEQRLLDGCYWPQEILAKPELEKIWRTTPWNEQ